MPSVLIDSRKKLLRSENQVSADLQDQVIILSEAESRYYALEGVGIKIWNLLSTPQTVSSIIDELLEEYDINQSQCEEDVPLFLQDLADAGLLIEATGKEDSY